MANDGGDGSRGRGPRRVPPDLAAVVVLVVLTDAFVLAPVLRETPVRAVLAFPLLLFLPGYALVAALYPERSGKPTRESGFVFPFAAALGRGSGTLADRRVSGLERVVLSVGLSVAVVALTGLALNFTPWGIQLVPIVASVSAFTVVAVAVAVHRRRALPPEERFSVHYRSPLADVRSTLFAPDTRTDAALNVLLALAVLIAATSVAFAVAFPPPGDRFTEFYLLTRTDDGDLVADDYPTELPVGEPTELVVGVGNQEHEPVAYTVVGELQRVRTDGNETTVVGAEEVARFGVTLDHNQTALRSVNVTPESPGERRRLVYLLYRGEPPADPSVETAYRSTFLWVNATAAPGTDA